jgi:predicted ATPase
MCVGVHKMCLHYSALSVTATVAGAVCYPLQRGEVVFMVPLRAGAAHNRVLQLKGIAAVNISIALLTAWCLCIAREVSIHKGNSTIVLRFSK